VSLYLIIAFFFAAGLLVNYAFGMSDALKDTLTFRANQWIIYVAMTSIIFLNVPKLEIGLDALLPAAVAWGWVFLSALLVLFLSKKFQFRRDITGVMLLLVPLGNTSFLGYPMVSAFFDDTVLAYAIFYDQFGSFMALSIYGTIVLAIYSTSSDSEQYSSARVFEVIKKVVTFPPLVSLVIALLVPFQWLLIPLTSVLEYAAATLVPLALFTLGLQFRPVLVPEQILPISTAIVLKMCLAPVLVWLLLRSSQFPAAAIQASVFESAMPSMMTPGILAIQAKLAPRFCATLLGYSTLFSMLTLPIVAFVLL